MGSQDAFERRYTGLFRQRLATFGEFVTYERDRAARDIGVHLTRKVPDGGETLSQSLCWFQLKGIQTGSRASISSREGEYISLPLSIEHLRFWYSQPSPTWLALFHERINDFLVLNLQKYVEDQWGEDVFELKQKTVTVRVPLHSVLDEQAIDLILRAGELPLWARITKEASDDLTLVQRDFQLIWRLATAGQRQVEHLLQIVEWQSKLRGEVYFFERSIGASGWQEIRGHLQYRLRADDVATAYPYLSLVPTEESSEPDEFEYAYTWQPRFTLPDGTEVFGKDASSEYFEYDLVPSLNDIGLRLAKALEKLAAKGLITIPPDTGDYIDIAPWHHRSV